jgi:hypothetical protein
VCAEVLFGCGSAALGGMVSRSYVKLIKEKPAEGWVKARFASSPEEALRLRTRIEELENALKEARTLPPADSGDLAQGNDLFLLRFEYLGQEYSINITWDELFRTLAPSMFHERDEHDLERRLNEKLREEAPFATGNRALRCDVKREDFETVKTQLLALGLIKKSLRPRSLKDTATYWTLTPYGETYAVKLNAVKRIAGPSEGDVK